MAKGLPRSIVKKYGVTKKAWAVYRGRSKDRRKPKTRRKRKTKKIKVRSMARRRRRSPRKARRRKRTYGLGGLFNQQMLLMGVGAGASGALGATLKKSVPQVPDNYAELGAGLALVMFGGKVHPALKTVGKGVMIKAIGDFVETNVMPKVFASGSSTSSDW